MIAYYGDGRQIETLNGKDGAVINTYKDGKIESTCSIKWDELPEILEKVKAWGNK